MQQNLFSPQQVPTAAFLLIALLAAVVSLVIFLRYTGLRRTGALIAWTCTLLTPLLFLGSIRGDFVPGSAIAAVIFVLTAVPFALRLYSKWRNHWLSEEEQAPGAAGLRAWLSLPNLLMAGVISVSGWLGFGWSLPLLLLLTVGSLVLWPALNPAPSVTQPEPPASNLSAEREKVLSLLEAGKISAEESAELLNALGSSARAAAVAPAPSRGAKLTLVGAAVVFVGFLLPWFEFAPLAEASRMLSSAIPPGFSQQMQEMMPSMPSLPALPTGPTVQITGGKVANGLGWIVLVGAVVAALLPHVAQTMHRTTTHTMRLIGLGVSSAILLYLATQSLRHVAIGLVITTVGLALEWLGLLRDESVRLPAASPAGTEIPLR